MRCGEVHPEHFRLLISLSGIQSSRVIMALESYLVHGSSRKVACEKHNLSASYMSVSLGKLQALSRTLADVAVWYSLSVRPLPGEGRAD
ncbi:transcriptional regulator [Salmonella enterica]|nr:transcriptional regulator [Salmonella enterica]EHC5973227.1 transcriptional regulator [Salmonella enterica]EIU9581666.1 transcriptional regulator [Salmonella enterica]ELC1719893.1 transcriptional regulator [Salmonella enterica]